MIKIDYRGMTEGKALALQTYVNALEKTLLDIGDAAELATVDPRSLITLAEIARSAVADDPSWQPIDTVPKDGSRFDCLTLRKSVVKNLFWGLPPIGRIRGIRGEQAMLSKSVVVTHWRQA